MKRECNTCKKTKPIGEFKMTGAYRVRKCYDCMKEYSNKNNHKNIQTIKNWAGECWWIEQYCYASLFYYNGQSKRR